MPPPGSGRRQWCLSRLPADLKRATRPLRGGRSTTGPAQSGPFLPWFLFRPRGKWNRRWRQGAGPRGRHRGDNQYKGVTMSPPGPAGTRMSFHGFAEEVDAHLAADHQSLCFLRRRDRASHQKSRDVHFPRGGENRSKNALPRRTRLRRRSFGCVVEAGVPIPSRPSSRHCSSAFLRAIVESISAARTVVFG